MEKINGELELAKKKRQVLDKLLNEGKVSRLTYDSFSDEIYAGIIEIETRQKALAEKMKVKIGELEQQMKALEFLLVNSEIRHVSGETEEEAYNRESNMLSLGLETTRQELNEIAEAIANLGGQNADSAPVSATPKIEEAVEQAAAEPEKRLEIVVDTETTTSIETTVEERSNVEEPTETPTDKVSEQEETPASSTEVTDVSFSSEEQPPSEGTAASETATGEETKQEPS